MKIYYKTLLLIFINCVTIGLLHGQSVKWTRIETPLKDSLLNPQAILMRNDYSLIQMVKNGNYISYDKGLSWLFIPYQNYNITENILSAEISSNNQLLVNTYTELVLTDFYGNQPKQIMKNSLHWAPGNLVELYKFTPNGIIYLFRKVTVEYLNYYPYDIRYTDTRYISVSLDGNYTFRTTYMVGAQNLVLPFKFHVTKSGKTFFQAKNKFLYLDLADTTWKDSNILPFEVGKLSDIYVNSNDMCLKDSQSYFYASSDEGISWRRSASPSTKCEGLLFCKDNRVFAKKDSGVIYSADYGNSWKYINKELSGNVEKIFGDSKDSVIAVTTKGMYLLTELFPANAAGKTKLINPPNNELINAAIESVRLIWNKTEKANSYEIMTGNKDFVKVYHYYKGITDTTKAIPAAGDTVYWKVRGISNNISGEWSDTWRYIFNGTVGVGSDKTLPSETKLYQNYPNPFNPSTNISYVLSSSSFVNLKIYDILGRELREILSKQQEPGEYMTQIDLKDCAGGIYYYRLKVNDKVFTKKMLYLK